MSSPIVEPYYRGEYESVRELLDALSKFYTTDYVPYSVALRLFRTLKEREKELKENVTALKNQSIEHGVDIQELHKEYKEETDNLTREMERAHSMWLIATRNLDESDAELKAERSKNESISRAVLRYHKDWLQVKEVAKNLLDAFPDTRWYQAQHHMADKICNDLERIIEANKIVDEEEVEISEWADNLCNTLASAFDGIDEGTQAEFWEMIELEEERDNLKAELEIANEKIKLLDKIAVDAIRERDLHEVHAKENADDRAYFKGLATNLSTRLASLTRGLKDFMDTCNSVHNDDCPTYRDRNADCNCFVKKHGQFIVDELHSLIVQSEEEGNKQYEEE